MRFLLAMIFGLIEASITLALCAWAGLDAILAGAVTILIVWASAVALVEMADRTYWLLGRWWRYRHPGR